MNYELAKQLKEMGFKPKYGWQDEVGSVEIHACNLLSELLEACGKDVILWKNETWNAGTKGSLYDVDGCLDGWVSNHQTAETPEEAVAKLWLALLAKE